MSAAAEPGDGVDRRGGVRFGDALAVALWSGVLFGLAEGAVLCVTRAHPVLHAAHKVPPEILWAAPLVDGAAFVGWAVVWWSLMRFAPARWAGRMPAVAIAAAVLPGAVSVLLAPGLLSPIAAVLLGLGVGATIVRRAGDGARSIVGVLRRRVLWTPVPVAAAALGVAAHGWHAESSAAGALPPPLANAPNVLIVLLDTVRADQFERPGGARLAPHLDRLCDGGVTFTNAWSTTSWSLPSQASILTGLLPHEHEADWPSVEMRTDVPSLPALLAARGYATGAFSGNSAWITPEYLGRGFLRFAAYLPEDVVRRTVVGRGLDKVLEKVRLHSAGRGKKAPTVDRQFLEFLDDHPGRPYFAYLCYMDVNQGLHQRKLNAPDRGSVPPDEIGAASDAALTELDAEIGRLLESLRQRGALDNTVVVVVSDHGESFGDDGKCRDHEPSGHTTSLYPEQVRVPLAVVFPGRVRGGLRIDDAVSIRQIPATILALLREPPACPGPALPLSEDRDAGSAPGTALATLRFHLPADVAQTVVSGRSQFIRTLVASRGLSVGKELFDLGADPYAWKNLASDPANEERMKGFEAILDRFLPAEPPRDR